MHPCVARTIDRLASISRVGSRLTHVKIPALKKRFQGSDAVGRQRRSALSLDAKFAPDSPLEGDGFEPSVPRQKDLCKHPRLPPIASTGGADRRENGEMPIWHRWVVSATAHPLRQIGQIGRVLRSPSRVRVA